MNASFVIFLSILPAAFPCCSLAAEVEITPLSVFADAFKNQQSNIQVMQEGVIVAVLSDDLEGDRHQRLIVKLGNDQTLLIAHNIDLAPRVPDPQVGKTLRFYGEYEWNDQGGVIHWTHTDPDSVHVAGWLEYEGKRYGGNEATFLMVYPGTPGAGNRNRTVTMSSINHHTAGALFDVQGRYLGWSFMRRRSRLYLIKSVGNRHGSIMLCHK